MITDSDTTKLLKAFKQVFATKDDLVAMEKRQDKKYSTKDDLVAMEKRQDKKYATRDEIKQMFLENNKIIIKEIVDYLQNIIIPLISKQDRRLDRLEKTVGGFPPITS